MSDTTKPPFIRPDCRVALVLSERGSRHALGCEILDASGRAGVKYKKFLGKGDYDTVLSEAVLAALAVASQFHKEKPEVLLEDAALASAIDAGLPGEKQLKEERARLKMKLGEFRSVRARVGTSEEMAGARELAESAFERN